MQLFFVSYIPAMPHVPDITIISLFVAKIVKFSELAKLSELSFLSELVIKWQFLAVLLFLRNSKTRTLYITCVDIIGAACSEDLKPNYNPHLHIHPYLLR